jgi:predicted GNAT family acetyltransferase
MAHPQKLRVTKKQAIINEIKRSNPDLSEIYLKREFYKVTNKNYSDNKINTSAWLKGRGITQCCQCRAWDNTKNKYKVCPVCLENKEERSKENFLRFKRKRGLELELGY